MKRNTIKNTPAPFTKSELLHGKALWNASLEPSIGRTYLREQLRELLTAAVKAVIENDTNDLEEFLR